MPEHSHPPARPGEGRRGPWHQRALTVALSVIYGVLLFWLLGFLVNDLGRWPAPDYAVVERSHLDPLALDSLRGLQQQRAQVGGDIDAAGERQATLRDSTASAETTLHRLLDLGLQALQRFIRLDPGPDRSQPPSVTELPDTGQSQREALAAKAGERRVDVFGFVAADLADEPQGEM